MASKTSLVFKFTPAIFSVSGEGKYFTISESSVKIPWQRVEEPMLMGTSVPSATLDFNAIRISSSEKVSPPK